MIEQDTIKPSGKPLGKPSGKPLGKTAEAIAGTFLGLVMERGYNAVSYADLARLLGIRTASIHYHFPSKSDLGLAVLRRYAQGFFDTVAPPDPADAHSYEQAFDALLTPIRAVSQTKGASCLMGVLGAEYQSLSPALQAEVNAFFTRQQAFLETLLEEGRTAGAFSFSGSAAAMARLMASALQGAILIKKARQDPAHVDSVITSLRAMVMAEN